ncbi:beta-glucanase (GH16 family) [Allocatelliglobosispora scoriae]|uniref:Beta-glucanase (GH16 family) n=1 Tax=Allocatelliglobosispora scoriae TaxID=643052 RepID=A0A841BQV8_9ACTN|nr:glycoside hydrolase family 16 protein [Allocatelliglobosispora scoriae]MBB5871437.1 beta-glucanase (GH16 family) [Allocatelliglobosispora scoriae]
MSGCGAPAATTADPVPSSAGQRWELVFRDDFDGAAGERPAAANWRFDLGKCYPGCYAPGWGTGEIETVTDDPRNVSLDGAGHLAITPRRAKDGSWTSGRIESQRSDFAAPAHGTLRVEGALRLPDVDPRTGAGYWPAVWMMGEPIRTKGYTGWPQWGELDLVEQVNGAEGYHSAMHCGSLPDGPCREATAGLGSPELPCPGCREGFHTFAVELDRSVSPQEVRFSLDGVVRHRVNEGQMGAQAWRDATDHGFFLILNVAIGGHLPNVRGGGPNAATVDGRPLLVDYLAVYERG